MVKKSESKGVELFDLSRIQIKAVGITPLLCHNPAGSMRAASGKTSRGKAAIPEPDEEAQAGLYRNGDGEFCFQNAAMFGAIVSAAELMKLKVGTGRMAPAVANILAGGLSVNYEVELVKLVHPKTGKPLEEYVIDQRRVVIPANGNSVLRARPRFDVWSATFDLLADAGDATLMAILRDMLPEILRYAGMRVGIGDFRAYVKPRPKAKRSLGGPFGKFQAAVV